MDTHTAMYMYVYSKHVHRGTANQYIDFLLERDLWQYPEYAQVLKD